MVRTSYTFLFQPYRCISEEDTQFLKNLKDFKCNGKRLITVEASEEEIAALEVDPELWVYHKTSYAPGPDLQVGHPVPFPEYLIEATLPLIHGEK
jgi:hypothetical protein